MDYAAETGCSFIETLALNALNIESAFHTIVSGVYFIGTEHSSHKFCWADICRKEMQKVELRLKMLERTVAQERRIAEATERNLLEEGI